MSKSGLGQLICVILLVTFIGVSFFSDKSTTKTATEIAAEVTEKLSTDGLVSFDKERLASQLGLNADDFDSFSYYGSEDIMDVREILVIKGKEDTKLKEAADIIADKAEEKYNTYKDYDPIASALLEKRVIQISRGAIIYIVHDDAASGLESFLRCTEE